MPNPEEPRPLADFGDDDEDLDFRDQILVKDQSLPTTSKTPPLPPAPGKPRDGS